MLARNFLKRLDAGIIIDRTKASKNAQSRTKIEAPAFLKKIMKSQTP